MNKSVANIEIEVLRIERKMYDLESRLLMTENKMLRQQLKANANQRRELKSKIQFINDQLYPKLPF